MLALITLPPVNQTWPSSPAKDGLSSSIQVRLFCFSVIGSKMTELHVISGDPSLSSTYSGGSDSELSERLKQIKLFLPWPKTAPPGIRVAYFPNSCIPTAAQLQECKMDPHVPLAVHLKSQLFLSWARPGWGWERSSCAVSLPALRALTLAGQGPGGSHLGWPSPPGLTLCRGSLLQEVLEGGLEPGARSPSGNLRTLWSPESSGNKQVT